MTRTPKYRCKLLWKFSVKDTLCSVQVYSVLSWQNILRIERVNLVLSWLQSSGSSIPLGVSATDFEIVKKKQAWPGEEEEENNEQKKGKITKQPPAAKKVASGNNSVSINCKNHLKKQNIIFRLSLLHRPPYRNMNTRVNTNILRLQFVSLFFCTIKKRGTMQVYVIVSLNSFGGT